MVSKFREIKEDPPPLFITNFSKQHKVLERIIAKHWGILRGDRVLDSLLPPKLKIMYRKAPTLRHKIARNITEPTFRESKGFYPCSKCRMCQTLSVPQKVGEFKSWMTGKEFHIREFITCTMSYVTYLLQCPCGLKYVGRTTRQLKVRITEHLNNIKKVILNTVCDITLD